MGKVSEGKYPVLIRYYFLASFLAIITFQFVTNFNLLFRMHTVKLIVAFLVGSFAGGLIFLYSMIKDPNRASKDQDLKKKIGNTGFSSVFIKNIFTYSFAGLVGMVVYTVLTMETYNNFMQQLFSAENMIIYLGSLIAAFVYGLFISIGFVKRIKFLYGT